MSGVYVLAAGVLLLGAILGLFYLKDRLESHRLARLAYSEPVMRFAVVAAVFIMVGVLMVLGSLIG